MADKNPVPVDVGEQVVAPILEPTYDVKPQAPPADAPPARKVAIIVNHGMGQQVPYETLELVANALWNKEEATTGRREPIVKRMVRLGIEGKPVELELARAEVQLTGAREKADDAPPPRVEAHLYEAYWAPLTEGKVTLRQVIAFLLDAGWNGIRNALSGSFRRWMFPGSRPEKAWQAIKIRRFYLVFSFLAAILAVLALVVINAMIVAAAASHALASKEGWPSGAQSGVLTRDLFYVVLCAAAIASGTWLLPAIARWIKPLGWILWRLTLLAAWVLTILGIAGLILMGGVISWHLAFRTSEPVPTAYLNGVVVFLLWGAAFGASWLARKVIVEYVGDVTAYIAAHTVSVFWEVRKAIYEKASGVARAVYRARTDDGQNFAYQGIIVVGHSLGSVIAYDVLNGLFIEQGFSANPLNVAERTTLFLTFGSPLDKTAFLFRTQKDVNSEIREADAAAAQPMIHSYATRPHQWHNIWSHSDWISGSLEYYDDWNNPGNGGGMRVQNHRDPEANAPLVAHIQYWENELFANILYAAATGRPKPAADKLTRMQRLFAWLFVQPMNPLLSAYRVK